MADSTSTVVITKDGKKHAYDFDVEMIKNMRKIKLGDASLFLLSPEDVIAFKSIVQREGNGKLDITDIRNIVKATEIEWKAVSERLKKCGYSGPVPMF